MCYCNFGANARKCAGHDFDRGIAVWQEDRHQKIRDLLLAFEQLPIDRLIEELGVSRETVRRDLMDMEASGELRRIRGGAVLVKDEDPAFDVRISQRVQEKRAICATALKYLKSGQTIFMDAGSTTSIMADTLAGSSRVIDLTIITNSLDVASRLAGALGGQANKHKVILLTGQVKAEPLETWGASTISDIGRYHADLAFIAPWSIDPAYGAMNHFLHGAEIASAMVRNATQTMIVADHSKIGVTSRVTFCPTAEIDFLIVDNGARKRPGFTELDQTVGRLVVAG